MRLRYNNHCTLNQLEYNIIFDNVNVKHVGSNTITHKLSDRFYFFDCSMFMQLYNSIIIRTMSFFQIVKSALTNQIIFRENKMMNIYFLVCTL